MTVYAENLPQPVVNETRGILVALAIIPLGIVAWGILWNFGFIASIVGFGVALGAMFLYRLGTGGRITRLSAIFITAITLVTLLLAFFGGMVLDGLTGFSQATGQSQFDLFFSSRFWDGFFVILNEPGVLGSYTGDFLLALLFGALGCFQVIRRAFREASASTKAAEVGESVPTTVTDSELTADADPGWPKVAGTESPAVIDTESPTEPDSPRV